MAPAPKSRSLELPPQEKGPIRLILDSQFCTKIQKVLLTPETSLEGKTVLITGSTTGLGWQAALHFLTLKPARLILAVRSAEKGERVAAQFRKDFPSTTVDIWLLDMGSYPSIQAFSKRAADEFTGGKRLDIAILNAGITHEHFTRNESTGHCEVIQINYLSTFLLAILLLPTMRAKRTAGPGAKAKPTPGHLTIVGSGVALMSKLPNRDKRPILASFDDLTVQPWDMVERYYSSKLLGHLFFPRLLEHLPAGLEDEVIFNIVDPGYCKDTQLHRDATGMLSALISFSKTLTARSLEDGAWTYVDAVVVKGKDSHGCFVMDWEIRPFAPLIYKPEAEKIMDALWEETMAEFSFAGVSEILESLK